MSYQKNSVTSSSNEEYTKEVDDKRDEMRPKKKDSFLELTLYAQL